MKRPGIDPVPAFLPANERHRSTLPKYLLLVAVNGFVSYAMIEALTSMAGLKVLESKLLAESILFAANFAIQRDFVFTRRRKPEATRSRWHARRQRGTAP